jgi:hypothetical protein
MQNKKRPLHTMTIKEFLDWTNGVLGTPKEEDVVGREQVKRVMDKTFASLSTFYSFLSCYGNFDSITWLIENNFDVSFSHAKANSKHKL